MDMFIGLAFMILTYVVFTKLPTPAVLLVWGFTGMFVFLNYIGTIGESVAYLMFIFLVVTLMVSMVFERHA